MKKFLFSSAILATIALFVACGDDSSSGPEEESSSSIAAEGESSSSEETSSSSNFTNTSSSQNAVASSSSSRCHSESSTECDEEPSSSSIVIASSSSANGSSSSEAVAEVMPSGTYSCTTHNCVSTTYLKSGITYGEILDTRDDQVYKTVEICNDDKSSCQTWMAQNLNYKYNKPTSSLDSSSFCYGGKADSCAKYGRLYLWSAAMDSAGVFSTSGKGCGYGKTCSPSGTIRGICPEGWHLPSLAEWKSLLEPMATSVDDYSSHWNYNGAGRMLKSEDGWSYYSGSEGIDYYGFSALPAGYRSNGGYFNDAGYYAFFWSSSEYGSDYAYNMYLYYYSGNATLYDYSKDYAISVRCVQN